MSRYIDADAFLKSVKQKAYPQSGSVNESERKISLFGIMEILTAMPTADVAPNGNQNDLGNHEIIPCKECKWHNYLTCSNPNGIKGWVTDNDFCSCAERRENEVNDE